jgi:hypothetical protein
MKRLLAGLALALITLAAAKPAWAGPVEPYITLDTPPPYHFGGSISVTTHGTIQHPTRLSMFCYQSGVLVYIADFDASQTETTYTLHFGTDGGSNQWVASGGGAADCTIRFLRVGSVGKSYEPYTLIDIHVEA